MGYEPFPKSMLLCLYYFAVNLSIYEKLSGTYHLAKSHQITLRIYSITSHFPSRELFGLTSQMRRSAASISTNIAEGCGKNSDAEMRRFLFISTGSSSELEYQLILSKDLNYIDAAMFNELQNEVVIIKRMIYTFAEKLK